MIFKTPNYETLLFKQVYNSVDDFYTEWTESGMPSDVLTEDNVRLLYFLLYARYANDPIANRDVNQWKYRLWSIMFQYGPTWQKRLDIQANVRNLTLDELQKGSGAVYNHAYNPSGAPATGDTEELDFINEQNTTNYKRSQIEAYNLQWDLLRVDVSEVFLTQFKKLFIPFVVHQRPTLYIDDDKEEEEDES